LEWGGMYTGLGGKPEESNNFEDLDMARMIILN
jgi:hypothetical protein